MGIRQRRSRVAMVLDGSWEFAWLGEESDLSEQALASPALLQQLVYHERAPVPGCFDTMPGLAGCRGTAAYRTWIEQQDEELGVIHFDGVGIWAAVFVDGTLMHVQRKPYSPFTVEVDANGPAKRELIVIIDNRFHEVRSPLQENYFDFYAFGGIFRPVTYLPLGRNHIARTELVTTSIAPPKLSATLYSSRSFSAEVELEVDGESVFAGTLDLSESGTTVELDLSGLALWSPEKPALHTLQIHAHGEGVDDVLAERFGLRTVEVKGREVLLNGKPLSLFGWNRHETHPQFGPALPHQLMAQDLAFFKQASANFVRGSHYPQDDRFLDLCDELGMLVWEESLGWQQGERHFQNAEYQRLITEQQREMIEAHFNHPSIVMWGFQNEMASDKEGAREVVARLAATSREADPSRPVTFATCRFPDDRCLDLVDIISLNMYPGWYAADNDEYRPLAEIGTRLSESIAELARQGLGEKPLIISEIGAGAIYGWRDAHSGHWSEQYQTDYLLEVIAQVAQRDEIMGLALWQFCDGRTYGSSRALGRPRSFNNKGVLDEYRRPKQAFNAICETRRWK
ncbi:MAG: glycoside hydrolase family 2 protein [Spirochaetota bacterium]